MKVSVVGGGPAGLFFAILLKRGDAGHEITVYEKNSANITYGFGVGFSKSALNFLQTVDANLRDAIIASSEHLKHLNVVHRGSNVAIDGNDFYGIERINLLGLLRQRALAHGVHFIENQPIEALNNLEDCDLVVGADGVNSAVRRELSEHFQPVIKSCQNKFIWYATKRISSGIELIFKETSHGLFIGHTYRYRKDQNTFVVECSPSTWSASGLDRMTETESMRYCESVFSEFLGEYPLISNQSCWFTPKILKVRQWSSGCVTLLGDALKTMHPSIGSGTKAAMQDAIALADVCLENPGDIKTALIQFEQRHRPKAEKLQDSALRSIDWYEGVPERLHLSPIEFAYDYMTRTGKIDHNKLREMDPDFVRRYELSKTVDV